MAVTGGTKEKIELKKGAIYLLRNTYYHTHTLQDAYVEEIAPTAYKFRLQKSDGTWYLEWIEKTVFEQRYVIDAYLRLPEFPPSLKYDEPKIEINNPEYLMAMTTPCPVCVGEGQVPDDQVTSGKSTCPKCLGSGRVWS